jgi:3-oxoacyl-[acyl-carrier-protein] synthase-3
MHSRIVGTGSYLPAHILTNNDLAKSVDTNDAWIRARTGIRERRIAAPAEQTSDLAEHAARAALDAAGIAPSDVDLIIVATTTPEMIFPSTACILQAKLGAQGGPAFDVQAVCSGFVYALAIADRMVAGGLARNALVVGVEVYSRILDWKDRATCVLFGDGAGAVALVPSQVPGIVSAHLHADGRHRNLLCVAGSVANGEVTGTPFVRMDGPAVFKFAVGVMAQVGMEALVANGVDASAVDWLIPHQANIRIIDATAKRLGIPPERVVTTVERHANTSAASIPLALDEAVRDGRICVGQRLLLIGVGGGFTWGSVFLTW